MVNLLIYSFNQYTKNFLIKLSLFLLGIFVTPLIMVDSMLGHPSKNTCLVLAINCTYTKAPSSGCCKIKIIVHVILFFSDLCFQIMQHKWAWPFMEPVDVEGLKLHDYYEVRFAIFIFIDMSISIILIMQYCIPKETVHDEWLFYWWIYFNQVKWKFVSIIVIMCISAFDLWAYQVVPSWIYIYIYRGDS